MKSNKKIKTLLIVLYVLFSSTIFLNNFKNNPQDKEDSKNRKDTELKEADPAYQLMITDTDTFLNPDHPDINITTVEVDDNSTDVLFRLSVAGSINFLHQYHIFLDYNQDGSLDHTLSMIGGSFFWDSMTPLPKSFISGNSLILVVPKTLETDSTFNISALTLNSMTVSVDNAPGDAGWSFLYTWQVGVGIEEPHLTGVYSDYGVDTNSDGKFEYLAIDVEINATIAGYYRVVITYLTNTSDFIYVTNSTFAGNLAIGKHTITVLLLGSDILRSRIDGPYTLYQVQLKYNFSIADTKFNPYTTSYYQYQQFGAPPAFFTDKYSDAGVDLNGNGLFEYLNFTIEVNTTVTGNYTIHLWFLLDPLEKPMYVSNSMTCDLVVGIQNISIPISGTEIYSSGIDGPYTIWSLTLEDSYFYQLDSRIKPYCF